MERSFALTLGAPAAVLCALLWLGGQQALRAAEKEYLIQPGDHYGLWHSDEAKFTIDKVDDNGKFSGHVELLDGEYKGAKFDITGEENGDGAITIKRADADQVCKAEAPEAPGFHQVWRGKTYIADTKAKLIFELRVRKKKEAAPEK
jgi:hypothetical protein